MPLLEGSIQVPRRLALAAAAAIGILLLAVAFMLGRSSGEPALVPEVAAPTVEAQVEATKPPVRTTTPPTVEAQVEATKPPVRAMTQPTQPFQSLAQAKRDYGECLARNYLEVELHSKGNFRPWTDQGSQNVWETIRYEVADYVVESCQAHAPPVPESTPLQCIPDELRSFYRRNVPEGEDNDHYRALAARYALAVCQPSAFR